MSVTLSYGFANPSTGDRGSVFFPIIEDNFSQLADHDHDGSNSALLSPGAISITGFTSDISSASWGGAVNGIYSQTVTVPAGVAEINNYDVHFYNTNTSTDLPAAGERLFLHMKRASATSYVVYINDNTINLKAVYK